MYLRCLNFECIAKSGAVETINNSPVLSEKCKGTTESNFEEIVKKIKLESSEPSRVLKDVIRCRFLFPELQTDDLLFEATSHELFYTSHHKICGIAGKYEVAGLFDILVDRLSYHNLADGMKPVSADLGKVLDSNNWQIYRSNEDCFIHNCKTNVNFESHKPRPNECTSIFSKKLKYVCDFINKTYKHFYFNTKIQYYTQLLRILVFFIFTIIGESNKNSFIFPLEIYLYSGLILCFFDFIFQFSNWKATNKINILVEAIFIVCLVYPKSFGLKNIISLASFYTSVFRLLFIFQCNLFTRYNLFQNKEVFRFFLKRLFISADTDFDSKISFSQFETICSRFGIDVDRKLAEIINIDEYILGCLSKIGMFEGNLYLLFSNWHTNSSFNKCKLFEFIFYSKNLYKLIAKFYRIIYFAGKRDGYNNANTLIDEIDIRRNFVIREIIDSRNINYEEFEELMLSLDKDGVLFTSTFKKYLVTFFDSNPYIFSRRKNFYENISYTYSLFLCLLMFIFIIFLELFPGIFAENLTINNNKAQIMMAITYFYLTVIIFCLAFHYKMDFSYSCYTYNLINRLINGYNKITTLINCPNTASNNFLEKNVNNLQESSYIFSEFLTNDLIVIIENTINSFSNYLPLNVTKEIIRNDGLLLTSAEYCEITMLFTDIVGFTSIAEKLCPFKLFELLTVYFDEMIRIVNEYDGILLEIVGDAILVIWNSPDIEDNRIAAINTSLQMKKILNSKSEIFRNIYTSKIEIKCGIHTDNVLIGNIGGKKRKKYGILGDGVNLASRVESLCKRYNADIIITNNVFVNKRVQTSFIICPLDVVIVQGKSKPTIIYQVIDSMSNANSNLILISKLHTIALILFLDMEFAHSMKYLEKIIELHSNKKNLTSTVLYNKCKHFLRRKPGTNWIRAEILDSKDFL
ncbi:membrane associated adenyl cyclase with 2 transmembrane regions and an adenylyl cyclase domain [Cryptosporidium bovis]|uniref:membrane associated adenyl cyclase with 2 transmembrane regions and an adenylyl cyclase domain n=1 Tax=Cryptosporidium bovis TaxID=310047 RepID=UPI00351A78C4|nr:membrane associated adenyl cyclase with 2 transmembrane regions and an adenylyl cyclase domain [Cryptosporidium bovis]